MTPGVALYLFAIAADLHPVHEALLRQRGKNQLTATGYAEIRNVVVRWVQEEVREGRTVAQMNASIDNTGLVAPWMADPNDRAMQIHSGYLAHFSELRKGPVRLLLTNIGTGEYCSYDTTVLVYPLGSRRPIAVLNSTEEFDRGRYLVNLSAYRNPGNGEWTLASAWFLSWCTGTYKEAHLRVDRSGRNLVHAKVQARAVEPPHDMRIQVTGQGNTVEFRFVDTLIDQWVTQYPASATYRIQPNGEVGETLLSRNLAGFLGRHILSGNGKDEWSLFDWSEVAHCGSDGWEVAIQKESQRRVFRVEGRARRSATGLRIVPLPAPATSFSKDCLILNSEDALRIELLTELQP